MILVLKMKKIVMTQVIKKKTSVFVRNYVFNYFTMSFSYPHKRLIVINKDMLQFIKL